MENALKKKLAVATAAYWFLLLYMVAALIWWFISLENQNRDMASLKRSALENQYALTPRDGNYQAALANINQEESRNTLKYVGEGSTFLALILVGAVFVFRAVKRQLKMQQQQQNFMMAVTHELKTPIAVAKLNLETLIKHELDAPKKEKILQMTLLETNRLNTLTNNILVSSQLESGRYASSKEELDFSELVKSAVLHFEHRFPDHQWNTAIDPEIDLAGDTLLLQILVNNLLENAQKYSPKGTSINTKLVRTTHHIQLEIKDEGPGIPDAEKQRIFEKFYRIGSEATRTTRGTGLGLYLCKKIARDHHGQIRVADNQPSGCIFTVDFKI